jgi:hypothetical protein
VNLGMLVPNKLPSLIRDRRFHLWFVFPLTSLSTSLNKFTGLLEVGVIVAKSLSARYPAVILRDDNNTSEQLVRLVPSHTGD